MTTTFGTEVIHIAADGTASTSYLTITDDDAFLEYLEAGTEWTLDGITLTEIPSITFSSADFTLAGGNIFSTSGISFTLDGETYFMHGSITADRVEAVNNVSGDAIVGGIAYTSVQAPVADGISLTSDALVVVSDGAGGTLSTGIETVQLFDDDRYLQLFNETGGNPVVLLGDSARSTFFTPDAEGQLDVVSVGYDGAGGSGSFDALRYSYENRVYYFPVNGSIDLADITSVTSVTLLATNPDGADWADFGFGKHLITRSGTLGADTLEGDLINDKLLGLTGADKLYGGVGADALIGGQGADRAFGGIYNDTLSGGDGADRLYGGAGKDLLAGGRADDVLIGGGGNDTLSGGDGTDFLRGNDGNDLIRGGGGSDFLQDGAGNDTLSGGAGADVFRFDLDFATDNVSDFTDGVDKFSLNARFSDLIISDVAPGTVNILFGDDLLVLHDSAGLLTAADITRADFTNL